MLAVAALVRALARHEAHETPRRPATLRVDPVDLRVLVVDAATDFAGDDIAPHRRGAAGIWGAPGESWSPFLQQQRFHQLACSTV